MTTAITIHLSDADYEAVRAAAAHVNQSPGELIAATVVERYGVTGGGTAELARETPTQQAKDRLLAIMRERGHLVDPKDYPPYPGAADLPPRGSPEEARLLEEIGAEMSDALERSGLSILDLIERR